MKRYISLILVAAVLVCCLAVPSYATESLWWNVLDFGIRGNNGSNQYFVTNGTQVTFDVPPSQIGYIDFVV